MNAYRKWGRSFLDSLIRHIGTSLTIWIGTEVRYQEINFTDLGMFVLLGAVIPTLAEFAKAGLPPEPDAADKTDAPTVPTRAP